jgi:uncharacterized protein (TIGR00255 family)
MTGFGSAHHEGALVKVEIELKSLNGKFMDLTFKMHKLAQPYEVDFRNLISQRLKRGKVQMNLNIVGMDPSVAKRNINKALFMVYKNELEQLADEAGIKKGDLLKVIMELPDVVETQEGEPDEALRQEFMDALGMAVDKLVAYREHEGALMATELEQYALNIARHMALIDANKQVRIDYMRKRLKDIQDKYLTNDQKDGNRLEQEMVFYLERFDITEELVRLDGHINYFIRELKGEGSGKKLGFIAQEMGREINTIGSKANDSQIQHQVVQMKDDLEKIKEQVLNIL